MAKEEEEVEDYLKYLINIMSRLGPVSNYFLH